MQMFNKISSNVVQALSQYHLELTHLWLLENIDDDANFLKKNTIPEALVRTLERKNYLLEGVITLEGHALLTLLSSPAFSLTDLPIKKVTKFKKEKNPLYQEWLNCYPATATFVDFNGHEWINSRILRKSTAESEEKYLAILNKGEFTHAEMCMALKFQVEMVIKDSMRSSQNKMMYFQGVEPYLNQGTFRVQIETMKKLNWTPNKDKEKELSENTTIDSTNMFG